MGWLLLTLILVAACIWLGRRLEAARGAAEAPARDAGSADDADPAELVAGHVEVAIGAELDLHGVAARDLPELVDEFLSESRRRGTRCVTIVHGRGIGVLRRRVRTLLARRDDVERYDDAVGRAGGATAVWLVPLARDRDAD